MLLFYSFKEWFSTPERAGYYGSNLRDIVAADLGIGNIEGPQHRFKFKATRRHAAGPGIDTARREELMRLGKGFDGGNYLCGARMKKQEGWDFLQKIVLRPEHARQFFNKYARRPDPVIREIERRQPRKSPPKAIKIPQQ